MIQGLPNNPIFSGTFERSMDAKNRVTIPSKWLEGNEGEFQIVPNPKGDFLMVMPPAEFANVEERIMEAPNLTLAQKRGTVRQFYSSAQSVATDKQGRVLLPDDHCQKVALAGEIILVGNKTRFEIWNKTRWETIVRQEDATYQQVAEEIGL